MTSTIKSEIRKLFTVRSTYIIIGLSLALVVLFAFYFEGWRGVTGSPASELAPTALQEIIRNGAGLGALFASIIAVLFMAHEYRYNTITYTLTASTRRSRVMFSKLLVITAFSVLYGLLAVAVALGSYMIGLSLRDADLPAQDISILPQLGKVAFFYAGYALLGMIVATIIRSLVGAVAVLLIYSITVEPLLSLLFKDNTKYLPIVSLDSTVGAAMTQNVLSPAAAIGVASLYLAVGTFIATLLFIRRDVT